MPADAAAPSFLSRPRVVGGWAVAVSALMLVSLYSPVRAWLDPPPDMSDLPQRVFYLLSMTAKALILQRWWLLATREPEPGATRARRLMFGASLLWVLYNQLLILVPATIADRAVLYQVDALFTLLFGINALAAAAPDPAAKLTPKPTLARDEV